MSNLHYYYDQLTEDEREACDRGCEECRVAVAQMGSYVACDDRCERLVDAIARAIIESRGAVEPPQS